jgi:hypothetical protein
MKKGAIGKPDPIFALHGTGCTRYLWLDAASPFI